jgi:hypothetical protein
MAADSSPSRQSRRNGKDHDQPGYVTSAISFAGAGGLFIPTDDFIRGDPNQLSTHGEEVEMIMRHTLGSGFGTIPARI